MRTLFIAVALASALSTGCRKKPSAASASAATTLAPSNNTNYVAGGGAVQNVRQAARRTVALNEMSQLGQLIELQYNETGKMPNVQQIKDNLAQAQSILAQINDGNIILTGTTDHAGLWAYEVDANTKGGIVLQAGSARRATKDEVKQLLGQ
jgi:hypothetical protein